MNIAITVFIGLLQMSDLSLTSSTLDAKQVAAAERAFQGMRDVRQHITSGVCRIKGTNTSSAKVEGQTTATESVDCYCAFDVPEGLYRFDRNTPPDQGFTKGGKFIRTPSHIYETLEVDPTLVRAVMRNRSDKDASSIIAPFDVCSVGLFNLVGPYWNVTVDKFCEELSKAKLIGFSEEGAGIYCLTWAFDDKASDATNSTRLWLDAAKGYAWIRLESTFNSPHASVKTVIETSWDKIADVWVPTAMRLSDDQSGSHTGAEWTIEWESVNKAVPADQFAPQSFGGGRQVAVYSGEPNPPVLIGFVGGPADELKAPSPSQYKAGWLAAMIASALLTLVVIALVARRMRRASA